MPETVRLPAPPVQENQLAAITGIDATFFLWNLSGQLTGYQVYRPDGAKHGFKDPREAKYFSYVSPLQNAVWGLETVHWDDKVLFLTEGIFDAARLHYHGLPAVLANNPVHLTGWLMAMPSLKVACVQGDAAGRKLAKFGDVSVMLPDYSDVGDLTEEEFYHFFGEWL